MLTDAPVTGHAFAQVGEWSQKWPTVPIAFTIALSARVCRTAHWRVGCVAAQLKPHCSSSKNLSINTAIPCIR